jgi:hypothetical protein
MKNCKEKIQAILNDPQKFQLTDRERWVMRNYLLNNFAPNLDFPEVKTDEQISDKLIDNMYGWLSNASLHEKNHDDFLGCHRILCYLLIVFHDDVKVRTVISEFLSTQGNLNDWYGVIRPFLRSWGIPGWKDVKDLF